MIHTKLVCIGTLQRNTIDQNIALSVNKHLIDLATSAAFGLLQMT